MPIIVNLDVMLAKRKMMLKELSDHVGVSVVNLSISDLQDLSMIISHLKSFCRKIKKQ